MPRFADRFKEQCVASGKTQLSIAKDLGITPQAVSQYKRGSETSFDTLVRIADYFGVTTDYLLGASETSIPETQFIGRRYGLNDRSIIALERFAEDPIARAVVNVIFTKPELLSCLVRYICARFDDVHITESGRMDMNLVRFVEFLPRWKDEVIKELKEVPDFREIFAVGG